MRPLVASERWGQEPCKRSFNFAKHQAKCASTCAVAGCSFAHSSLSSDLEVLLRSDRADARQNAPQSRRSDRGAPRGMNLPDPRRVSCYDDFWWLITSFPSYLNHSESCRWQGSKGKLARQGLPGGPQRLMQLVPRDASHAGGRGGRRWRQLHQGWMEWSWSHTEPNAQGCVCAKSQSD